jgi:hypothetical protein
MGTGISVARDKKNGKKCDFERLVSLPWRGFRDMVIGRSGGSSSSSTTTNAVLDGLRINTTHQPIRSGLKAMFYMCGVHTILSWFGLMSNNK